MKLQITIVDLFKTYIRGVKQANKDEHLKAAWRNVWKVDASYS